MAASWRSDYQIYRKYLSSIASLYQTRQDLRIYTELLMSLLTIAVFAIFAIRPTLTTIAGLNSEINAKDTTIKQMDTKIQSLAAAQVAFEREKDKISLLDTAIPGEPLPDSYIRQIEGIAQKNNTQISTLTIGSIVFIGASDEFLVDEEELGDEEVVEETLSNEFDFSVSATGDYQSLSNLLSDLENLRRPFVSDNIRFSSEDAGSADILTLTATGRIPYLEK